MPAVPRGVTPTARHPEPCGKLRSAPAELPVLRQISLGGETVAEALDRAEQATIVACDRDATEADLQRDHDLAASVPLAEVAESVGDLAQLVPPVDDRCHLAGLEELGQYSQVGLVQLCDEEDRCATGADRGRLQLDHVSERPEQAIRHRPSDQNDGRGRLENAPALAPRPAPGDVDEEVVAAGAPREVLAAVV